MASAIKAIDQAALLSQVTSDFDGEGRPAGNSADVGADEDMLASGAGQTADTSVQSQNTPALPTADIPRNIPGSNIIPANFLQPADLIYQGAFRYPDTDQWTRSGQAIAFYPKGDPNGPADGYPGSLYAAGHPDQDIVWEFSIPVPVIAGSIENLPAATVLRPWFDITGG